MKKHTFSLPNILTYARILSVPLVSLCFFLQNIPELSNSTHWAATALFVGAGLTDFLDGFLARIWQQTSSIGQMLDPIADKLLVASCLLLLSANHTISGLSLFAAIIILCREILVSGLREYLAELKVRVPVSRLAKWKTAMQMIAIIFLLSGPAGDKLFAYTSLSGLALLWIAALLTLATGWEYFRHGIEHIHD